MVYVNTEKCSIGYSLGFFFHYRKLPNVLVSGFFVSQRVEATKSTIQELQKSHDLAALRNVRLEARSRWYNVKFFRLPEAR